MGEKHLNR